MPNTLPLAQQKTAQLLTSLMIHIYQRVFKSFEIVKSDLLLHTTSPHNLGIKMILDNWQQKGSDTTLIAFCQFIDGLILDHISESPDRKVVITESELTGFILCATCSLCRRNIWIDRSIYVNAIIQDGNVVNLEALGQNLVTYISEPVVTNITKYIDWQIFLDLDYLDAVAPYVSHIQNNTIHRVQQLVAAAPHYWKAIGSKYMSLINTDKLSFPIIKYLTQIPNNQFIKMPQHWVLQDFKWLTPEIWAISQLDPRLSAYILGLPLQMGVPGPKTIYKSLCLLKRLGVEQYTRHMCIQGSHLIVPSYDQYFEFTRPHFNEIINTKQNLYTKRPINRSELLIEIAVRQNMVYIGNLPEATSLESLLRRYITPTAQVVNNSSILNLARSPYGVQECMATNSDISTSSGMALSRIIPIFTSSSSSVSYPNPISNLAFQNSSSLETSLLSHMNLRSGSSDSNHLLSLYIPTGSHSGTHISSSMIKTIIPNTVTSLTHNSHINERPYSNMNPSITQSNTH
jgi:hypothetical protein